MIKLAIFLFLTVIVVTYGHPANNAFNECKSEYEITKEQLTGDHPNDDLKCFYACILTKSGFMDDEGNFNHENIKLFIDNETKDEAYKSSYEEIIDTCIEHVESNSNGLCENGYQFVQCLSEEAKRLDTH